MKFKHVLCVPEIAVIDDDLFDSDEARNAPTLVGIDEDGRVWLYDKGDGEWNPHKYTDEEMDAMRLELGR